MELTKRRMRRHGKQCQESGRSASAGRSGGGQATPAPAEAHARRSARTRSRAAAGAPTSASPWSAAPATGGTSSRTNRASGTTAWTAGLEAGVERLVGRPEDATGEHDLDRLAGHAVRRASAIAMAASSSASRSTIERATASPSLAAANTTGDSSLDPARGDPPVVERPRHRRDPRQAEVGRHESPQATWPRPRPSAARTAAAEPGHPDGVPAAPVAGDVADAVEPDLSGRRARSPPR